MTHNKSPNWLIETQNKSWEPEILISGITLTFLFILSNHIYNFFGMLVQDFGVIEAIPKTLYIVSIIILTGLKIILIIHLILRGVWTGFVGLSYVFPRGVRQEKLPRSDRKLQFDKPEIMVIRLEKICSLLFSFIFSSIAFFMSFYLMYIPLILLYMTGLRGRLVRFITLGYALALILMVLILSSLFKTKLKSSGLKNRIGNSVLNLILNIYYTNIGKARMFLIFALYFLIVVSFSFRDITGFRFKNNSEVDIHSKEEMVMVNNDLYKSLRDSRLRIPKACIDHFRVTSGRLTLFIASYREDSQSLEKIKNNPSLLEENGMNTGRAIQSFADLLQIAIDGQPVSDLKWYRMENRPTGQKGIRARIALPEMKCGCHELKISKVLWQPRKKKLKLLENWLIIPFELERDI
jgi:hypothetical protein